MAAFKAIRGMNDVIPENTLKWQHVERIIAEVVGSFGFGEIRFPVIESTSLFARSIGEVTDIVEKEMYTFLDRNGDSLTLRPEGTASCVRAGIENGLLYNQTQKLWYMGPMFRHERPQKGRYRQFHQCGVEAFGFEGPDIDAELILLSATLFKKLGITDLVLEINSLGDATCRANHRAALVSYFEEYKDKLDEDCLRRLGTNPLRILDSKNEDLRSIIDNAPSLAQYLDDVSNEHFDGLKNHLTRLGINFVVNPQLVRGLDYYCKTVFEWKTNKLGAQGTVCAGGRYDGLVEQLGGKPTGAVGLAFGIERIIELCEFSDLNAIDAYIVVIGGVAQEQVLPLSMQIREACPKLKLYSNMGGGKFANQLKKAVANGAKWAIVLGEDEVQKGVYGLKQLRGNGTLADLKDLSFEQLVTHLKDK